MTSPQNHQPFSTCWPISSNLISHRLFSWVAPQGLTLSQQYLLLLSFSSPANKFRRLYQPWFHFVPNQPSANPFSFDHFPTNLGQSTNSVLQTIRSKGTTCSSSASFENPDVSYTNSITILLAEIFVFVGKDALSRVPIVIGVGRGRTNLRSWLQPVEANTALRTHNQSCTHIFYSPNPSFPRLLC